MYKLGIGVYPGGDAVQLYRPLRILWDVLMVSGKQEQNILSTIAGVSSYGPNVGKSTGCKVGDTGKWLMVSYTTCKQYRLFGANFVIPIHPLAVVLELFWLDIFSSRVCTCTKLVLHMRYYFEKEKPLTRIFFNHYTQLTKKGKNKIK